MEKFIDPLEKHYQQLRRLGQRLGIPTFEAFLEMEVQDGRGRIIHSHRQRSHSWTRNAYNSLFCQIALKNASDVTFGAGKLSFKAGNNSIYSGNKIYVSPNGGASGSDLDLLQSNNVSFLGSAGADNQGIIVGSGNMAESFEDYALATKIAHGNTAGQLSYSASNPHAVGYNADTKTLIDTLVRYFNNNSGGSIEVREMAIATGYVNGGAFFMMSRDVLGSTITIPNTGQLKVTYTIQLVYPA